MSLLRRPLAHSDLPQVAIVDIQYSAPSDGVRVDIEPGEFSDFLMGQIVGVGFVDSELLETTKHYGSKLADAVLLGDKAVEEGFVLLGVFVEHPGLNCRSWITISMIEHGNK